MKEKINHRRWGFKERLIRRWGIWGILLAFAMIISLPATAVTTSIHIVKYANDNTTILNETTKTNQWLELNLPVVGDGITHYYSQGPTFNDSDLWDNAEWQNVETRDWGAVKGTDLKDICNLVGGMSMGETVKIKASDGFSKTFPYEYIYTPNSRQGPMGITWYRADQGYVPAYVDGMRLIMFADAKTNTYGWNTSGWHVFGNADMRDCWAPNYWYNYSGTYPSSGGVSVKTVSDIIINSTQAPPVAPSAAFFSDIQSGSAPLTVQFTDISTNTPTAWNWSFRNVTPGNNTQVWWSTVQSPMHTFGIGNYSIVLNASNSTGYNLSAQVTFINVSAAASGGHPTATVGIYRNGVFYLRNSNSAGNADLAFNYGIPGDTPLVGDWDGNSVDTVGIYRNGVFYLRNSNTPGNADLAFNYGIPGDTPLVGDWDGNSVDTIGIYRNGVFYLRNSNTPGNADLAFNYGIPGDTPLVGDWDGT